MVNIGTGYITDPFIIDPSIIEGGDKGLLDRSLSPAVAVLGKCNNKNQS